MKKLILTIVTLVLALGSTSARDIDEVIVVRQLSIAQRKSLPENTIEVETKKLQFSKKADVNLVDAITQLMDSIVEQDYLNRTFEMLIEPKDNGEIAIAINSDDIVTRHSKDDKALFGDLQHERYHFVVLTAKFNKKLLESLFKRDDKIKFVQEYEFVQFKTPTDPTHVIADWVPGKGLDIKMMGINVNSKAYDDGENERPMVPGN